MLGVTAAEGGSPRLKRTPRMPCLSNLRASISNLERRRRRTLYMSLDSKLMLISLKQRGFARAVSTSHSICTAECRSWPTGVRRYPRFLVRVTPQHGAQPLGRPAMLSQCDLIMPARQSTSS
jgi:hypothetical protein